MNELFNQIANDVVFALAWTLIHSIWQFAIVVLCFLGLSQFIKRSALRYQLAIGSLLMCALLSLITFHHYYSSIHGVRQAFTAAMLAANHQEKNDILNNAILFFNKHLHVIMSVWFVGFSVHLGRTSFDFVACKKLIKFQSTNLDATWENKFLALQGMMGLSNKITYKLSSLVNSPCVVGVFKPVILIPPALLLHLPTAQIEAVILHELAHIKRNDYLINLLQCIIKGIFFFNPFMIYLSKTIDQERENSCDDIAVHYCGSAMEYSKGISKLAELNSFNQLALAAKSKKYSILPRIRRLFGDHSSDKNATFQLFCSTLIGIFGLVMAANIQALPNTPVHIKPAQANQTPVNSVPVNQAPINPEPIRPTSGNAAESNLAKESANSKPEDSYAAPIVETLPAASTELPRPEPSSVVATATIDYVKTANEKDMARSNDLQIREKLNPKKPDAMTINSSLGAAQTSGEIKSGAAQSANGSDAQSDNNQNGSNASHLSKWDDSWFANTLIDRDVDFSKYDEVIVLPTTFDKLSISEKTKPAIAKAWMRSSFKEMDRLCLYFDKETKRTLQRSDSFRLTNKGGGNVLVIEIRMIGIFPLSASKMNPKIASLILQAAMVDSKTGRLVAVAEENIAINARQHIEDLYSRGSDANTAISPSKKILSDLNLSRASRGNISAWAVAAIIFSEKLHSDMKYLKYSNFN